MIYLAPQVRSGLGEDTFWTWFNREFNSSFDMPAEIGAKDVVLQYSTLGASQVRGGKKVALLWELHPEMVQQGIEGDWSLPMQKIRDCEANSDFAVIASPIMREFYRPDAHLLPIGVDTVLFHRMDKQEMRAKHSVSGGEWGFFCGTPHQMKGSDRLNGANVIKCWKEAAIPQAQLAEKMNCADYIAGVSRLRPFFMAEWEAMACGVPYRNLSGLPKDFEPSSDARDDVFRMGWSRHQAKKTWSEFLGNVVGADF